MRGSSRKEVIKEILKEVFTKGRVPKKYSRYLVGDYYYLLTCYPELKDIVQEERIGIKQKSFSLEEVISILSIYDYQLRERGLLEEIDFISTLKETLSRLYGNI